MYIAAEKWLQTRLVKMKCRKIAQMIEKGLKVKMPSAKLGISPLVLHTTSTYFSVWRVDTFGTLDLFERKAKTINLK